MKLAILQFIWIVSHKVKTHYKSKRGKIQEEQTAVFTRPSRKEALLVRQQNEELAERKYGKENVIKVELIEMKPAR